MSDLHLEVNTGFVPSPHPLADVLVLAGDIGSYQSGSALQTEPKDFGLTRFSPALGAWPAPVIFVPGNHEFDGQDLEATRNALRQVCKRLGIVCLDDSTHHLGDVRFVGSTLWSDFDALADEPQYKRGVWPNPETRRHTLREKAFRAANHHLSRFHATRDGQPMLAAEMREHSLVSQAWLRSALQAPHTASKTVVITHFAPSLKSQDPRYGLQPGTCGFCNALDELVPLAHLWLHGHLHWPSNYAIGITPVRSNPLGYRHEQGHFEAHCLIEI